MPIKLFILSFFTLITISGFYSPVSYSQYYLLLQSKEQLAEEISRLQKKNKQLAKEIRKINNSRMYAQKILKDKYHILEPGEEIIFFAD